MSREATKPAEKADATETRKSVDLAIDKLSSLPQDALSDLQKILNGATGDRKKTEELINRRLEETGLVPVFTFESAKTILSRASDKGEKDKQFSANDLKVLGREGKPQDALHKLMVNHIVGRYDALRNLDGDGTGVSIKDLAKWNQRTITPGEEKGRKYLIKELKLDDKSDQSLKKGRYLYDVAKEKLEFMNKENPDPKKAPVTSKDVFSEVAKMMARSDRGAKFSELDPKTAADQKQKAIPKDWNSISSKDKLEVFTKGDLDQIKKWRDARNQKGDPVAKNSPLTSDIKPKETAPAEVQKAPLLPVKPADLPVEEPAPVAPLQNKDLKKFNPDGETKVTQPDGSVLKLELRDGKIVAMNRVLKILSSDLNAAVDDSKPENHQIVDGGFALESKTGSMINTEYANGTVTLKDPEKHQIRRVDTIINGRRFVFQHGKNSWEFAEAEVGKPVVLRGKFHSLQRGTNVTVDKSGAVKVVSPTNPALF